MDLLHFSILLISVSSFLFGYLVGYSKGKVALWLRVKESLPKEEAKTVYETWIK